VKSAGNSGPDAGSLTSPADADGVVVVGATEREGTSVQDYSSRGPTANGKHPHLVAPGGNEAANMITCLAEGGFGDASFGTSLAAPVVAGAAALLRQQFPTATPDDIRTHLLALCRPLAAGDANAGGAGLVDLTRFSG
jgi:serine protease AprX